MAVMNGGSCMIDIHSPPCMIDTISIIIGQMPKRYWTWEAQPKGVANRNNALNWIINHSDQVRTFKLKS